MSNFTEDDGLISYVQLAGYSTFSEAIQLTCQAPDIRQSLRRTWVAMMALLRRWKCPDHLNDLSQFIGWHSLDPSFFLLSLVFSGLLTWARFRMTPLIRSWARSMGVRPSDVVKVPESVYKLVLHTFMWLTTAYVVFLTGRYSFFSDPCTVWKDISTAAASSSPISRPWDLTFIYFVQLSYYLHSAVATVTMDSIKADTGPMLVHHVITISLIALSYSFYFLRIGVLVMFLHDFSDFVLEFTKLNLYLSRRNGREIRMHKILADAGFVVFMLSWIVFRLYWYPLKVFMASNWCFFLYLGCVNSTLYIGFNILLLLLQILHIYWFKYILELTVKVVTGQVSEIQDTRELDVNEKVDKNGDDSLRPGLETDASESPSLVQNGGSTIKSFENGGVKRCQAGNTDDRH